MSGLTLLWHPSGAVEFRGPASVAEAVNERLTAKFGTSGCVLSPDPVTPTRRVSVISTDSQGLTESNCAPAGTPEEEECHFDSCVEASSPVVWRGVVHSAEEVPRQGPTLRDVSRAIEKHAVLMSSLYLLPVRTAFEPVPVEYHFKGKPHTLAGLTQLPPGPPGPSPKFPRVVEGLDTQYDDSADL
eukprot:Hpha_TRINITY_DN16647_c1_g6::TRINITY_DN16647_c1_g6_i1::g.181414::m.181414